jgi:hypothetical protein
LYWRDPSGKPNGRVVERRHDGDAFGRLIEQWKQEGTYFDQLSG